MASPEVKEAAVDGSNEQRKPRVERKSSGLGLANFRRAAFRGRSPTMSTMHQSRSDNWSGLSPTSPGASSVPANGPSKLDAATLRARGSPDRDPTEGDLTPHAVAPTPRRTAWPPPMQRSSSGGRLERSSRENTDGAGSDVVVGGRRRPGWGSGTGTLPRIRKGYLLMRRGVPGGTGEVPPGAGGAGVGTPPGAGAGAGAGVGEWSERFFYLSGHFLRYKKHSLNLTSVNLTHTDHVEFDLQSAVVESLDEAGDGILRSRKTYAFRLVNYDAQYAAVRSALTRTPSEESRGSSTGAGGESGKGLEGQVGVERNEGKMDGVISGMDDSRRVRQIWLLAANSFKERAMWIEALREAISLGQQLLDDEEGSGESGSLAALATRMSSELEVRDRRYRLRVYRSVFTGEDAVSWLQSESENGPCSVEEAVAIGNKMIAAGLIYHCTYGHDLENKTLFYKYADSVLAASQAQSEALSRGGSSRSRSISMRQVQSSTDDGVDMEQGVDGEPFRGTAGKVADLWAGEGSDGRSSEDSDDDDGEGDDDGDDGDGDGDGDDGDDRETSGASDAEGAVTSPDVGNRGPISTNVKASGSRSIGDEGSGYADSGGGRVIVGGSNVQPRVEQPLVADGRGRSPVVSSRGTAGGASLVKRDKCSKRDHGAGGKLTLKRMAREVEALRLCCAELERSQLVVERQALGCATRILTCLEKSLDRLFFAAAAFVILVALVMLLQTEILSGISRGPRAVPHERWVEGGFEEEEEARGEGPGIRSPWEEDGAGAWQKCSTSGVRDQHGLLVLQEWMVKFLVLTLVGLASYAYARSRAGVRAAVAAARAMCNDVSGFGPGRASTGESARPCSSRAVVPLLHPSQAQGSLFESLRRDTAAYEEVPLLVHEARAIMASNRPIMPHDAFGLDDDAGRGIKLRTVSDRLRKEVPGADSGVSSRAAAAGGVDGTGPRPRDAGGNGRERPVSSARGSSGSSTAERQGSGPGGSVLPAHGRPELESLPPEEDWPHHPIFVRLSPSVPGQVRLDGHEPASSIPVNSDDMAVPFETPLFKGRLMIRVAGLPSRIPGQGDGAREYFRGKKRLVQCAVQGCFKREIGFDRAYTGQAYSRPFTRLPAKWLIRSAFAVIRRLSPALREDITGDNPYMVSPLAATAQTLRAEEPGDEVAIVGDLGEETALLGPSFMERRVPASARKKFFSNPRNLKAYSFKPGVVYTFDFYQHLYNPVTFELDLGFRKVKLADYLNHQPAQIMVMDLETGEMLWNVEIWNSVLLKHKAGS